MKRITVFLVMASFLGAMVWGGVAFSGSADPKIPVINKGVNGKNHVDYLNEDDLTSDSDGAAASQQSIKAYVDNDEGRLSRIEVIDSYTDLSTWSGAASGSSYFQMEANKIYIVDFQAIQDSGGVGLESGVSAHLPLATSANSHQTVTAMWATTSGLAGGSGTSEVTVWPAPLAGSTVFGTGDGGAIGVQNMTGMVTSGSSVITVTAITGSRGIDAYGEIGTWGLFWDSAVSAQMVDGNLP